MNDDFVRQAISGQKEGLNLVEKLLGLAGPKAVFGEPMVVGDRTLIPASEHWACVGYGFGMGSNEAAADAGESTGGSGGGGGGFASSRPVAIITIGSEGVKVQPVVDGTKVALAFVTMLGTLLALVSRMRRASRG